MTTLPTLLFRNGAWKNIYYTGANIGPHSSTSRATYTVPAGKKALVLNISVLVQRFTAPTTPGDFSAVVSHTPNSGYSVFLGLARSLSGVVGAGDADRKNMCYPLDTYDMVSIVTKDGSTGGTVDYFIHVAIWEYT
jgi:hypothetical protein